MNSGATASLSTFFAFTQTRQPLLGSFCDSNTFKSQNSFISQGINHLKPGLGKKGNLLAKDSEKSRDVQACSGMAGSGLKLCQ